MAATAEKRMDNLENRLSLLEPSVSDNKSKVSELEQILGIFIVHTERSLIRLEKEMKEFKDEMKDFKNEMKDFKDEMKDFKDEMKDFKDEMKVFKDEMKDFKDEMRDFKDEMKDFKDEMKVFKNETKDFKSEIRSSIQQLNKKWGELANKMGTMVEDIVAPSIPQIAKEIFGCDVIEDFMVRRWKRQPGDASKRKEFDIIAVCKDRVVFVEIKETLRQHYLEDFANFIKNKEFFSYFPEYRDKELIPVFGSLYLPVESVNFLSNRNIYALTMNEGVVQIVNPEIKHPLSE